MTTIVRKRTAKTDAPPKLTPSVLRKVASAFAQHRLAKSQIKALTEVSNELRDVDLLPLIETYGAPHGTNGQHLAIELDPPVDGQRFVVRERRVSSSIDVDKAEGIAKRKGVLDKVQVCSVSLTGIPAEKRDALEAALDAAGLSEFADVVLRTEFSQERFYALHQSDRTVITERDIDKILVETESFSLVGRAS